MLLTSHIPSGPVPLHDALPPIISKLLLAALKIYRRLSFMTISTFLRARPTVCFVSIFPEFSFGCLEEPLGQPDSPP